MDVPVALGSVRSIGARTFDFSRQVAVMAIVNRTRDSFYDGGRTFALDRAVAAAERVVAEGADWVDVGAVPFSPRAREVTERDELERLLPLVEALRSSTDAVISVDTVRAEVARRALAAGADAVNDTSGLHDPDMAGVVAAAGAHLVITHSRAAPGVELAHPQYADVVSEVREFLAERVAYAVAEGVPTDHLVVDPGHDLNKNTIHSLELTRRLGELTTLGHPLLVSVSNKDFLQETLNRPADALTEGTVAAVVLCVLAGARVVRVHDVAAVRAGLGVVEAVLGWRPPAGPLRHNL
ncbi:MAG: folP [Pseudonocardia sp.]|jgi:dihydropteroate synthase|nr:folP [Pseudonocardia sp.]